MSHVTCRMPCRICLKLILVKLHQITPELLEVENEKVKIQSIDIVAI